MKRRPDRPIRTDPRREAVRAIGTLLDGRRTGSSLSHPLATSAGTLEQRDVGLAMEICQGVVRRLLTLDTIINSFLRSPVDTLPPLVRDSLRAGAYQLLYLDRVPDHAAVNEAVNIARDAAGASLARLTNGVLRNLIRRRDGDGELLPPVAHGADRLALEHSYPLWLVRRWWERFGPEETARMLEAGNLPPSITLRVKEEREREEVVALLRDRAGIAAEVCTFARRGIRLPPGTPVSGIPGELWGVLQVQDEASQLIGELLEVGQGDRVLDACAAPGGKTTILAEGAGPGGEVIAVEADPDRIGVLRENVERLDLRNVRIVAGDVTDPTIPVAGEFNRVLLDAPCTGLGVLRRHPEIKWRRQPVDLVRNGQRALAMLHRVSRFVGAGGILVYAVCSTEPEEGEQVAEGFAREHPEFVPVPVAGPCAAAEGYFRSWPHRQGIDGFFGARWRRVAAAGTGGAEREGAENKG